MAKKKGKSKPRSRSSAEANRRKIFDAANSLFVDFGFDATSMSEIAKLAGVNKSLIYHHFSSKDELWEEVLFKHTDNFVNEQIQVFNDPDGYSRDFFSRILKSTYDYYEKKPETARILHWANMDSRKEAAPTRSSAQRWMYMQTMVENVKRAQHNDTLRKDIYPLHIALFLIGMFDYWFINREKLSELKLAISDSADNDFIFDSLTKLFFEGAETVKE